MEEERGKRETREYFLFSESRGKATFSQARSDRVATEWFQGIINKSESNRRSGRRRRRRALCLRPTLET